MMVQSVSSPVRRSTDTVPVPTLPDGTIVGLSHFLRFQGLLQSANEVGRHSATSTVEVNVHTTVDASAPLNAPNSQASPAEMNLTTAFMFTHRAVNKTFKHSLTLFNCSGQSVHQAWKI
jgi:hypothetical protein